MLTSLLGALALGVGVFGFVIWAAQDRLVYFPERELVTTPRVIGFAYEDVWLSTEDGVRVHGWFIPAPSARATLLFLHGNGGNISHRLEKIAIFRRLGLEVLIVDYRGYGQSEGKPSEEGTYRDARAAWRYLTQTRGLAASRIVVYGESLGGAVAAQLSTEQTPRALILESSFTSVPDLGAEVYPWLPVRLLARYAYSVKDSLARVQGPVLIVHSRDDEIVPFHHAERLFAAAREPKRLLAIRGGHNDGFILSGERYVEGLDAFLRTPLR